MTMGLGGRLWVAALLALAMGGLRAGHHPLAAQAVPPTMNVVVLIIDDIRWDSIGAAGNAVVRTPRIDQLAAGGVRFAQARVTTSICMVSRATMLTGQYMSRHGITAFGTPLTPEAFAATYPGVLRRAGYWTGHVGKYDVGRPRVDDYDVVRAYHGAHWMTDADGARVHVTERNTRDALDFLRTRPAGRPFVLTVGFFAPHAEDNAKDQYLPQDWSRALYDGVTIPPPRHGDAAYQQALPPFLSADANEGRVRYHWRFDTPDRYQAFMTRYYRLISEVDRAIGRVVDELKAQGVYDRTLIVVVGDNGYFHGDRGLADKWYPYEASIRVPLIVHDPRLDASRRGRVEQALALNIDVAPSVLAATGHPVPASMQGRDLAALYLGDNPVAWRDEFFYEHPTITRRERIPSSQAVVRRDWKYVEWPEWDHRQLFDLRRDPEELRNLVDDPAHAADRTRLAAALARWRDDVRR